MLKQVQQAALSCYNSRVFLAWDATSIGLGDH